MPTAIFYSLPFSGHINPALPLVKELVQRGEQIYFYATEDFRERIEFTGAHFRSYGQYDISSASLLDNPFKVVHTYLAPLEAVMEKCLPEAHELQPDYILHDTSIPWGSFIAELLQVPSIGSQGTLLIKSEMMLFNLPMFTRMLSYYMSARKEASAIDALLKKVAHKYHITPKPLLESIHFNGDLTIVYASRAFQPMQHLFKDNFLFIGPSVEDRGDWHDFPLEQLEDRPVIYISLGTLFNKRLDFYKTCLKAFAGTQYKVVISTGQWIEAEELGPLPENFMIGRYLPQLHILSRTVLFISHGGINSVLEALWYGVPLLLLPQWGDQYWIAQHIQKLGAGKAYTKKSGLTASRLYSLATTMLSQPAYTEKSKRLGESLQAAGGARKAADAIEALLQQKKQLPQKDSISL
jgi:MGT family glycosyltransferase